MNSGDHLFEILKFHEKFLKNFKNENFLNGDLHDSPSYVDE